MGGGPPCVRFEAVALGQMVNRDWSGSALFAVERREGGSWVRVGVFGSPAEAAEAIDEDVGRGEGTLQDYEIEVIPQGWFARHRWAPRALVALAVVAAGLLVTFLALLALSH